MVNSEKLLLIEVAGGAHGPEVYARSPVHDNVADCLKAAETDIEFLFVPSASIEQSEETGQLTAAQMPPSWQLGLLHEALEEAKRIERTPIALAHSSGSIPAMAALREGSLPFVVFVSPVFLDPRMEILGSRTPARRLELVETADQTYAATIWPEQMNYPTIYPKHHFDDSLYQNPLAAEPCSIGEVDALLKDRARVFIGEYDWNVFSGWYPELFDVEVVSGEKHSFEIGGAKSAQRLAEAIISLTITGGSDQQGHTGSVLPYTHAPGRL